MAYKRSRQTFEADLQRQESPYVFHGTPLPPLDGEVRDDGSFVPIWKQEVIDDRGRKRLHGAFTGGLSAGYYNTVGSKEGWTPATFVSSRSNRMKDSKASKQMRPEDFMDEEDLKEAEDSRQLETSESFTGFGTEHDVRHRDVLMDLFRPAEETVGIRLLRKMGWKEDQHKHQSISAANIALRPKNDRKGLGFEAADSLASATDHSQSSTSQERKLDDSAQTRQKKSQKAAFGVGIMNDTGSDDEDPYSMGPQISYNRVIGGDKKQKKKASSSVSTANPSLKSKPVFLSKKLANMQGVLRKCHDGRLPLEGFVLGDEVEAMASLSLQNDRYKPPDVPADWKLSLVSQSESTEQLDFQSVSEAAKSSTHDAKSRASLLGETQLPGKSVFDYLSSAARDRLAKASGKNDLPPALGEKAPDGYQTAKSENRQDLVPKLDQEVALQALTRGQSGWMPYSEDEAKRDRYKAYLEIRAGFRPTGEGDELPSRAEGVTQEAWIQEMQEFARAAQVFRPVTGQMASRFTSSTSNVANSSDPDSTESLLSRPKAKPEDPSEAAARMGMFGPMTRSVFNFYPTRLLCKRFNVPMPEHTDVPQPQAPVSMPDLAASVGRNGHEQASSQEEADTDPPLQRHDLHVEDVLESRSADSNAAVDPDRNEALEKEKPGEALFKAIFGSDDEDE